MAGCVDKGHADDFEDALFGDAGAGRGDFAFVFQDEVVLKQLYRLQKAEAQEQWSVQVATGGNGDGGWDSRGDQPTCKARRKRSDGPPQVKRSTGSLCKAVEIAADPAPNTAASKVIRAQL